MTVWINLPLNATNAYDDEKHCKKFYNGKPFKIYDKKEDAIDNARDEWEYDKENFQNSWSRVGIADRYCGLEVMEFNCEVEDIPDDIGKFYADLYIEFLSQRTKEALLMADRMDLSDCPYECSVIQKWGAFPDEEDIEEAEEEYQEGYGNTNRDWVKGAKPIKSFYLPDQRVFQMSEEPTFEEQEPDYRKFLENQGS